MNTFASCVTIRETRASQQHLLCHHKSSSDSALPRWHCQHSESGFYCVPHMREDKMIVQRLVRETS
jgi:hypothetical protein